MPSKKITLFSAEGLSVFKLVKVFYPFIWSKLLSQLRKKNAIIEIKTRDEYSHIMHLYLEGEIPSDILKDFTTKNNAVGKLDFKPIINKEFFTSNGGVIALGGTSQHSSTKMARDYIMNSDYISVPPGRYQVSIYPLALSNEEISHKYMQSMEQVLLKAESNFGIGAFEQLQKSRNIGSYFLVFAICLAIVMMILRLIWPLLPDNFIDLIDISRFGLDKLIITILIIVVPLFFYNVYSMRKSRPVADFVDEAEKDIMLEHFPTMLASMRRIPD